MEALLDDLDAEMWLEYEDMEYAAAAEIAEKALRIAGKGFGPSHSSTGYFLDWTVKIYLELDNWARLLPLLLWAPAATGVRAGMVGVERSEDDWRVIVERTPLVGDSNPTVKEMTLQPQDLVEVMCTRERKGEEMRMFSERIAVVLKAMNIDMVEGTVAGPSPMLGLKGGELARFHPSAVIRIVGPESQWKQSGHPRLIVWDAWLTYGCSDDEIVEEFLGGAPWDMGRREKMERNIRDKGYWMAHNFRIEREEQWEGHHEAGSKKEG